MRILLITPPMVQLNTPYPATPYLAGVLAQQGAEVIQADVSLELALRMFSRLGVQAMRLELINAHGRRPDSPSVKCFVANADRYSETIEPVVRFLQGRQTELAHRICTRKYLPEGPRFAVLDEMALPQGPDVLSAAFGAMGVQDRAKYLASLYIDDVADFVRDGLDPAFELSRYAEKLAASAPSFTPLRDALEGTPTLVDKMIEDIAVDLVSWHNPDLVAMTVPFPGNLYGALRIARKIKAFMPWIRTAVGGGYVSTELRELAEPLLFDYVNYAVLDAGERPLLCIAEHMVGRRPADKLCRTFVRDDGVVRYMNGCKEPDLRRDEIPAPVYAGLPIDKYLSLCEMPNPMYRLWSDGRWNKMILAHGCYWKRCAFCDTTLDYIKRFEPDVPDRIVDHMKVVAKQTWSRGFHFVDEAAPPALLGALAERIVKRKMSVTWWTNIRFENTFTPELAEQLARSGCIAVSGGLETACDRLLAKMNKGLTVEQAVRVTHALSSAGIMVHTYLMYSYPTQTLQEVIDALEVVRQMFEADCIQSAFWHRFALTVHSPISLMPERHGIKMLAPPAGGFAKNEVPFKDRTRWNRGMVGDGLRRATYNYMLGLGLDADVQSWFAGKVPSARVPVDYVAAITGIPRA